MLNIIRLIMFQHDGRGLNWETSKAQKLVFGVLTLPLFVFAARHGIEELVQRLALNWVMVTAGIGLVAFLLIHFQRNLFIRTEVGVVLLCLAFYVMRLGLIITGLSTNEVMIYALYAWQACATLWYIRASRITVTVTTARQPQA